MGHYSAAQTVREIQNFHMDTRGWSDIGYNFLINSITGKVYEGRGWTVLGAHGAGHNTEDTGVCIIGKDKAGVQDVSDAARRSFRALYEDAKRRKGGNLKLLGHRDRGSTTCPRRRDLQLAACRSTNRRHVAARRAEAFPRPTTGERGLAGVM
ncbi:hypothetical protein [Actinoplanes sp. NBRC 103695]|uniref:hypothetical protein n=1 Tax=Actinoplanes sp. NBRC 103695 TaxID=3032202 RepID=UPI0024A49958|nr:hypothetical protein [Actinoplanes sp. NBRC 103695]GLY96539.1 hypothetical protein Acsp02_37940 [Actinoplanes sp. NBRC 103695]